MNKNRKFASSRVALRQRATTRAIRAALLGSVALLALGGAPAAFAQTCTDTGTLEVTCSGVFDDNVENSIPPGSEVPDLTLILDDTTVVTPAAGIPGLTAGWGGTVTVISDADITTSGADGIVQYGSTAAVLASYGDITTEVLAPGDNAVDVSSAGYVDITIGGNVLAYNTGAVDVVSVLAQSLGADTTVTVDGYGSITALAYDGDAYALVQIADGSAFTYNDGSIDAESSYGAAFGVVGIANNGDTMLNNTGSISAYGYYDAEGVSLNAVADGNSTVDNSGDVLAVADGALDASAMGIGVFGGTVTLYQSGTVVGAAYGVDTAYARGVGLRSSGSVFAYNYGTIAAYADGAAGFANALEINANDYAYVYNGGDLVAYATGGADATGSWTRILGPGDIDLVNGGYIGAGADYGNATGVYAAAVGGNVSITNYGDIYAYSYAGGAVAVSTCAGGGGTSTIDNFGSITGDVAISNCGGSTAFIYNGGDITGPILTSEGDDYLYNAGNFNATGVTDLGAGDDTIVNTGNINMTDATISLGDPGLGGNNFFNHGTVAAEGYNVIDMGLGNPNPFNNYGHIDMQDGDTDDTLVVLGDFAGGGQLDVDADGSAPASADLLYITGNVDAYSTTTINVDVLDLSDPVAVNGIALVGVGGDSTADNFELGTVNFDRDNSFVDLGFSLNADIDPTNATPDIFSLGIAVTGLTDVGTIATTVAPSVHSLFATEIGTWRQRMGVIDEFNKGAVSLWARVFYNRGDFSPGHDSDDFDDDGNFDYESFNSGAEAGVDFSVTDELSIGLLASKSRAKNTLDPGIASSKVEADVWGIYGTWLTQNGWYLDASYRWMNFETTLESSAGVLKGDGDAEAFNVEVGYAFKTAGGFIIEPQLQYTDTNITDIDPFITSSGQVFQADGGHSSRGRAGVAFRKAFGDADTGWLFTPYLTLSVVEEFDGDHGFVINNSLFGRTNTEGTSGMVELGATARHEGWSIYGGITWQDGGALNDYLGGHLGVRYTFGGHAVVAPPPPPPPAKTCADLDDDGDGVNNCDDRCAGTAAGTQVGPDGCPVPPPEPVMEPKPYRN